MVALNTNDWVHLQSHLFICFERRFGRLRLRHFVSQEIQHLLRCVPLGHLLAGAHPLRRLAAHRHLYRPTRGGGGSGNPWRLRRGEAAAAALAYLHDELPPAGQPPLRHHAVLWLLLLLGLLDLRQAANGIHPLAVLWARLELWVGRNGGNLKLRWQLGWFSHCGVPCLP